jgi:hypothetical protein
VKIIHPVTLASGTTAVRNGYAILTKKLLGHGNMALNCFITREDLPELIFRIKKKSDHRQLFNYCFVYTLQWYQKFSHGGNFLASVNGLPIITFSSFSIKARPDFSSRIQGVKDEEKFYFWKNMLTLYRKSLRGNFSY